MKKIIHLFTLLAFLSVGFTYSAHAQATPKVKKRQVNQQKRIKRGVASGELTKRETVQLQKQQVHINRSKNRAKADGVVTGAERAKIHRKQNRASKNVARKKNNKRDRN